MKKCPYCQEEIQDSAVKCRYCGEWLNKQDEPPSSKDIPADKIATQQQNIAFHTHEERSQIISAGNKWFRWGVFVIGTMILAFIFAVWKMYDESHGGVVFVGFLRGAICSGGIIWLFYWAKGNPLNNLKQSEPDVNNYRTAKIEKIIHEAALQPAQGFQKVAHLESKVKQQDEKFIELLKSSIKENGLNKISGNELIEIFNGAKAIEAGNNELDNELSNAIKKLSDELKKRGLYKTVKTQGVKPQEISNYEGCESIKRDDEKSLISQVLLAMLAAIVIPLIIYILMELFAYC